MPSGKRAPRSVTRGARLVAVLVAITASAGAPTASATDAPPNTLLPGVPVVPYDTRIVVPTDTVVTPPAADFVPTDHRGTWILRTQMDGPNIAWGRLAYNHTRTGPAAGVHVSLLNRQTGWSYATTTDRHGRFRAAVPNGTYAMLLTDPASPAGLWFYPENPAPFTDRAYELWGGGLGAGRYMPVIPRPRQSCSLRFRNPHLEVQGTEGWAAGSDVFNTPCPFSETPAPSFEETGGQLRDDYMWMLTGRDPTPPDPVTAPPPAGPAAQQQPALPPAGPVVVRPATGPALRSRTVRPDQRGRLRLSVACAGASRCRVRLVVNARSRFVVAARRTLPASRTTSLVLGPGPTGRARLRRARSLRVEVSAPGLTTNATVLVRR